MRAYSFKVLFLHIGLHPYFASNLAFATQPAPDFECKAWIPGDKGPFGTVNLSDFKGKWLVLYFYPLDFTVRSSVTWWSCVRLKYYSSLLVGDLDDVLRDERAM